MYKMQLPVRVRQSHIRTPLHSYLLLLTTHRMSGPKPSEQHVERAASPDPDILPDKHTAVDEELRQYVVAAGSIEVDEATNKRLRRLIDKRVLVVMTGTYFLQSLDKNAISFAAIMGIQEDAHLVGQDVGVNSSQICTEGPY